MRPRPMMDKPRFVSGPTDYPYHGQSFMPRSMQPQVRIGPPGPPHSMMDAQFQSGYQGTTFPQIMNEDEAMFQHQNFQGQDQQFYNDDDIQRDFSGNGHFETGRPIPCLRRSRSRRRRSRSPISSSQQQEIPVVAVSQRNKSQTPHSRSSPCVDFEPSQPMGPVGQQIVSVEPPLDLLMDDRNQVELIIFPPVKNEYEYEEVREICQVIKKKLEQRTSITKVGIAIPSGDATLAHILDDLYSKETLYAVVVSLNIVVSERVVALYKIRCTNEPESVDMHEVHERIDQDFQTHYLDRSQESFLPKTEPGTADHESKSNSIFRGSRFGSEKRSGSKSNDKSGHSPADVRQPLFTRHYRNQIGQHQSSSSASNSQKSSESKFRGNSSDQSRTDFSTLAAKNNKESPQHHVHPLAGPFSKIGVPGVSASQFQQQKDNSTQNRQNTVFSSVSSTVASPMGPATLPLVALTTHQSAPRFVSHFNVPTNSNVTSSNQTNLFNSSNLGATNQLVSSTPVASTSYTGFSTYGSKSGGFSFSGSETSLTNTQTLSDQNQQQTNQTFSSTFPSQGTSSNSTVNSVVNQPSVVVNNKFGFNASKFPVDIQATLGKLIKSNSCKDVSIPELENVIDFLTMEKVRARTYISSLSNNNDTNQVEQNLTLNINHSSSFGGTNNGGQKITIKPDLDKVKVSNEKAAPLPSVKKAADFFKAAGIFGKSTQSTTIAAARKT